MSSPADYDAGIGILMNRLAPRVNDGTISSRSSDHGDNERESKVEVIDLACVAIKLVHENGPTCLQLGNPRMRDTDAIGTGTTTGNDFARDVFLSQ